jgi:HNH endonuclease
MLSGSGAMLNGSAVTGQMSFWEILKIFWSEDRIREWRNPIFSDQHHPDKGVETCYNLICLSPNAHTCWTKAHFALKPIQLSDDKRSLDVEFHWMPQCSCSMGVDILTRPELPGGLGSRSGIGLFRVPYGQPIRSGDMITLTTDNPEKQPLPHFALLEMQWILNCVAAMSGAAEIYDDDDDDAMAVRNEWDSDMEDDVWDS